MLFGDVHAKAGDLDQAKCWYTLARAVGGTPTDPWPLQALADARLAGAEARVARYLDADPTNDDLVAGRRAYCHNR